MRVRTEFTLMTLPFLLLLGAAVGDPGPRCAVRIGLALGLQEHPKISPFEGVRWDAATPVVRVGGAWYTLVALDGHDATAIVAFSKERFGDRWKKRFEEDLVWLLYEMGHDAQRHVKLELEDEDGQSVTLQRVEMTADNRRAIYSAAHARGGRAAPAAASVLRVVRSHASAVDARYASLGARLHGVPTPPLARAALEADLDQLEWAVRHRFSYRDRTGVDVAAAFDAVRASFAQAESVPTSDFALALGKLIALFGDGHARVSDLSAFLPGPYLPFLVVEAEEGLVALRADRSGYLDPRRPLVAALDGVPIESWIEAASRFAAQGSSQFRRRHGVRNLRWPAAVRQELGLPSSPTIAVELRKPSGKSPRTETLALADERPLYGEPPPSQHRLLDGGVGYLRIPRMDDDRAVLAELTRAMERFRDAPGLVIDVRENGGGSRAILRHLFPYFLGPNEDAFVANVARYRLDDGDDPDAPAGYLANRWLFPAAWPEWSAPARAAITALAASFEPRWTPSDPAEFSAPHYFVLERSANPDAYPFDAPAVILMDTGCFSATDVFLGAFAGRPNVTLVGRASGGGSGRSRGVRLAHSGLEVRLSSMVSYRPTGAPYDGAGIAPDVLVPRTATDWMFATDTELDRALELLEARR